MNTLLYICYSIFKATRAATPTAMKRSVHQKARERVYPGSGVTRQQIADYQVEWAVDMPDYDPPDYTANVVKNKPPWADKPDPKSCQFNIKDGLVNRRSFVDQYKIVGGYPQNPKGRTGLKGRGLLGKWGPNHAADPIVTRWKRGEDGEIVINESTGKKMLQFVAIMRSDSGEWAIPGGMVDAGENVSLTLKREFGEEALNSLKYSPEDRKSLEEEISKLFAQGEVIYKGYVDDPRNTDNAWMETVAVNFHDDEGTSVAKLPLEAGDDAGSVRWMTASSTLKLYASHSDLIKETVDRKGAHW